jgi:disulfide oxidoreductase YuzD
LNNGDQVIIFLKDRSKPLSEEEREWYEHAFGKKRNMMTFEARYIPLTQQSWMKGSQDIYLHLKYKMYPEMYDEFNPRLYDEFRDVKIKMTREEDDNENFIYSFKKEFPYGDLEWEYLHRQKDNDHDEFQKLLTSNPHNNLDYIKSTKKPTPISAETQRMLDQAEEEENKKREHEARMA